MFLCVQCQSYVHEQHEEEVNDKGTKNGTFVGDTVVSSTPAPSLLIQVCQVCGNVWNNERGLKEAIQDACRPYGGLSASSHNHVAHPITVSMAGNVRIRLSHFQSATTTTTSSSSHTTSEANRAMLFLQDIKRHLQQQADRLILASRADQDSKDDETEPKDHPRPLPISTTLPHQHHSTSAISTRMIHSEQQGYLSIHI